MSSRWKARRSVAMLAALIGTAAASTVSPVYRTMPTPGVRHYNYEVIQTINDTTKKGYRTQFDLESKGNSLFAIVRATSELNNGVWKPGVPDAACREALNGSSDSLARVQLYPLDAGAAHDLGSSFLDLCAPPAIFFPLTDILNVMVIPIPGPFRAHELRKVGDVLPFPGFEAAYDRAGEQIRETTAGGKVRLASLDRRKAVIEWLPDQADLELVERGMQPPMESQGTEHFAFQIEVDRRSGAIERASTTYDNLDLKIVGVPDNAAHIRISRAVTITRTVGR
jgi:hypothetical protein